MKYGICISSMLMGFLLIAGSVYAQQNQQHMMQQMKHMQEMTQRMNQMNERVHMMNQEMSRRMQEAQNKEMQNQYRQMHRMGEQLGLMLGNMKNAAERCDLMLRDRDMMRDKDMQRDMDRMREHLSDMTDQMDESIKTMERINERLKEKQVQKQ